MIKLNMPYTIRVMLLTALTLIPWVQQYGQTPAVSEPAKGEDKSMVLIGGGKFIMGKGALPTDPAKQYKDNPAHEIILASFYIDRTEVTNAQYLKFCEATRHNLPEFWGRKEYSSGPEFPDHPVTGVSYSDALEFAVWAGKRLPTEAEWEFAARGGLAEMDFPNGSDLTSADANFASAGKGSVKVGSFPANAYGLFDMAGNVGEWVADYYDGNFYRVSPQANPSGPDIGRFRVIRGGGWHSGKSCCRVHYRNALPLNWVDFNIGFRCAKNASK
jgi:formylglycine-generating enzyme required for sulfatase activity